MTEASKIMPVAKICPICHHQYYDQPGGQQPTCGSPDCIREARKQGLPFTSSPPPGGLPTAGEKIARRKKRSFFKPTPS